MEREYVGIDLHRRRSVVFRMDEDGTRLSSVRIDNEPFEFAKAVSAAPVGSDVIIEATYGWYWAADLLRELGYVVHLANPHGNDWGHRRVKNDERDARDLADLAGSGASPRRGSPHRRLASCESSCASGPSSPTCAPA
ncbi:MAG: transposase [Acidimicrobiales bacterium]|jgi:transposase